MEDIDKIMWRTLVCADLDFPGLSMMCAVLIINSVPNFIIVKSDNLYFYLLRITREITIENKISVIILKANVNKTSLLIFWQHLVMKCNF